MRDIVVHCTGTFSLYEGSPKCLHSGGHKELVEQLLGELINEVFALNVQLHGREINQSI
ncbi:hypothetical protein QM042_02240 [Escherichia coli]|uniref:hypothetical protein n=1 Tax=Escherichia coli TaxID=562 RepID=UPI00398748DA